MEEIIPSRIASKRIKYLEINLTMEVRGLYTKMYKTLMKKIEDTNKRYSVLTGQKNFAKMLTIPKVT